MTDFETGKPDMRDPSPFPGEDVPIIIDNISDSAERLRDALWSVLWACNNNATRERIAWRRMAGKPYSTIAAELGISKQAIDKHITEIEKKNCSLGKQLREGRKEQPPCMSVDCDIDSFIKESENKIRSCTKWLKRKN